jgi:hypothetical protein
VGVTLIDRPPHSSQAGSARRELNWLVPVLVSVSVVATIIGLLAFINETPTTRLHSEVTTLTERVSALETQVRAEQRALTVERHRRAGAERMIRSALAALRDASNMTASAAGLNLLHADLFRLGQCLPQLQRELGSLRVQSTDVNGWLTGVTLQRGTVPTACASGF